MCRNSFKHLTVNEWRKGATKFRQTSGFNTYYFKLQVDKSDKFINMKTFESIWYRVSLSFIQISCGHLWWERSRHLRKCVQTKQQHVYIICVYCHRLPLKHVSFGFDYRLFIAFFGSFAHLHSAIGNGAFSSSGLITEEKQVSNMKTENRGGNTLWNSKTMFQFMAHFHARAFHHLPSILEIEYFQPISWYLRYINDRIISRKVIPFQNLIVKTGPKRANETKRINKK